jgi:cyclase
MRRISDNAYSEIYFWGCNPSFLRTNDGVVLIDTPQQPKDAVSWREAIREHGPIRYLINTEPHTDHILGNAYFPSVEVVGQQLLRSRYEKAVPMLTSSERLEAMKESDPDSVWLFNHPDYPPNPPRRLFEDELSLVVGGVTIQCLHMPGHTKPQTSIYVPSEGVVFTGDNVFSGCRTFLQEADPWEWLGALDQIGALEVEVIVPGHGEPVSKEYLTTQAEIIQNWLDLVQGFVDKGISEDELDKQTIDVTSLDPYPIGQRLFPLNERLISLNVRNLFQKIVSRTETKGAKSTDETRHL